MGGLVYKIREVKYKTAKRRNQQIELIDESWGKTHREPDAGM